MRTNFSRRNSLSLFLEKYYFSYVWSLFLNALLKEKFNCHFFMYCYEINEVCVLNFVYWDQVIFFQINCEFRLFPIHFLFSSAWVFRYFYFKSGADSYGSSKKSSFALTQFFSLSSGSYTLFFFFIFLQFSSFYLSLPMAQD